MLKQKFRPDEVVQILRVSRRSVYRMLQDGRLTGVKLGTGKYGWRVTRDSLEGFNPMLTTEKVLTPREVAELLKISRSHVYTLYGDGTLRGVKISRFVLRIWESSVNELIKRGRYG